MIRNLLLTITQWRWDRAIKACDRWDAATSWVRHFRFSRRVVDREG